MAASGNSRFVQLNDYILLEYVYTSLTDPEKDNTADVGFLKIENGYFETNQIMNEDSAEDSHGNVMDRTATQISDSQYAHLDIDRITNYLDTDDELTDRADTPIVFTPNLDVPYDTVRFHILAGYNFEDLDGVIFQISAKEVNGKYLTLSQIALLKSDDFITLNPRPIFLGDRLYDRYVETKIPTLKIVIDEYLALEGSPGQADTFVARVTSDGKGLIRNNPIKFSAININSSEEIDRQLYLNIGQEATVSIKQQDEFALFVAVLQDAASGDYFEYYGSFDGGFAEDFIANLNAMGNDYMMIHELVVSEQIGNEFTGTQNFASLQSSGYDEANLFRPVLDNADSAVSFTIDYQLRLVNKKDNTQLIRSASLTSFDVGKWGKELQKLNLKNDPDATSVFNKVVEGTKIENNVVEDSVNQNKVQTRYVPSFLDKRLVSVKKENLFVNPEGQLVTSKTDQDQVIYGQGEARIIIDPFDTFVKIIIFTADTVDNNPIPMDLGNNSSYQLVFLDNDKKKVRVDQNINVDAADPTKGELLFKVPSDIGIKLRDYVNREFFVISIDPSETETKVYQGIANTPEEIDDLIAEEQRISEEKKREDDARITELENQLAVAKDKLDQSLLSNQPQGSDPDRIKLKPSRTEGGTVAPGGTKKSNIEIPGLATSHVTMNPVQLILPNQDVIDSKSNKFQKDKNQKERQNSIDKRKRKL